MCFPVAADEPELEIVLGYEGMARYAAAAEYSDPRERPALFRRFVYDLYQRRCGNDGALSQSWLSRPFDDIAALDSAIEQIRSANIEPIVRAAFADAQRLLPIDNLTVCVFVYPADSDMAPFVQEQMGGVMGFSESRGLLWLQILPTENWQASIGPAFAHEYFHAATHPGDNGLQRPATLLDYLVNEGGADSFAAILFPDFVPEWTRAISPTQERALWSEYEPILSITHPASIDRYLFGDGDAIPVQAGYTIGFNIMQAWLEANPGEPVADWARLEARQILNDSGYPIAAQKAAGDPAD